MDCVEEKKLGDGRKITEKERVFQHLLFQSFPRGKGSGKATMTRSKDPSLPGGLTSLPTVLARLLVRNDVHRATEREIQDDAPNR